MSSRLLHPDEYELVTRSSIDSQGTFNLDEADFESQAIPKPRRLLSRVPFLSRIFQSTYSEYRRLKLPRPFVSNSRRPNCLRRIFVRRLCYYSSGIVAIIAALAFLTSILSPSYTRPPTHYDVLRDVVSRSTASGRGNFRDEKVLIAASLYDPAGELAGGEWGNRVLQLIELLGEENAFLSIYENDSGTMGAGALVELEDEVPSNKSIIFEEHMNTEGLPTVTAPDGSQRIKRIGYLAEVRNRALRPLDEHPEVRYDKILYLNDVIFDPVDALQLLFSTNSDENGVAQYRAACAVDFINPLKFYDTYATRDIHGYSMGLPFFPWFSNAGQGLSRKDVLAGTDAVRVRSCWGGMVAFDARFFQLPTTGPSSAPARFRASHDAFWEASECCLIHADIQESVKNVDKITDTGIYMNPFVRVAYDVRTHSWLGTTRKFERLYTFLHNLGNHLIGLPWSNSRRTEVSGQNVTEKVWVPGGSEGIAGSFQTLERVSTGDGFCGRPGLQVILRPEDRKWGEKNWEEIPVPS